MTTTPKRVFFFGNGTSEGDPERRDILGGKGAGLAAMCRAGLPVPPGFTISAECCPLIEQAGGKWPEGLEDEINEALERLEQVTGRMFGHGSKPLLVAVRSGAAVSMPGMMDTILNCGMNPGLAAHVPPERAAQFWKDYAFHINMFAESVAGVTLKTDRKEPEAAAMDLLSHYQRLTGRAFPLDPKDALFQCIDAVFRSFNSERAKAYRQHNDIRGVIGTAVNVQAMFPSERAGILFTANPNNVTAGEMVLEASWGLGEVVVSGAVTPDIYVLDAETLAIKETIAGERPKLPDGSQPPALTEAEIMEIGRIGKKVEAYFGVPQDIEWGLADGRFNLLQSRNIRNLDVLQDVEVGREAERERLLALAGGKHTVWVVHNLSETLSAPTPLTWDIIRHWMSGSGGYGLMYQDFGYQPSAEVCSDGFLEIICGRIYVDPRRAAGMYWRDLPGEYRTDEILKDHTVLDQPPKNLKMEEADPAFFMRLPRLVLSMIRSSKKMKKARANAVNAFEKEALPRYMAFLAEFDKLNLGEMPAAELVEQLDRLRAVVLDDFGKESLKPGYFGAMAQQGLQRMLVQLMGDQRGVELTTALTTGLLGDITVAQNILLYDVARGRDTLDSFMAKFGHRATGEMELATPRWSEDPSYIQRMVETFRTQSGPSPSKRHARQVAAREKAEAELPQRLAEWGGSSFLEQVQADMREAQTLLPYRETGKYYLMMGYARIRFVLLELAKRWDLGRDIFFLHLDELRFFESRRDELRKQIAERKLRWKSYQKLSLADVIDSEHLEQLGRPQPRAEGEGLTARPLASGTSVGTARVIFNPQEAGDLGTDYILVCPSTDPGWTPLFVNARGLVVERGGILSHGAIVARDFGIPAVVCEHATELIRDGARIELDGNRGTITLLN